MEPTQTDDPVSIAVLIIATLLIVVSIVWIASMKYSMFKSKKKK
jgi:hypothetical protein